MITEESNTTICVIFHCGTIDSIPFFVPYINNVPKSYDLFITIHHENYQTPEQKALIEKLLEPLKPNKTVIIPVPNRGMDGGPFMLTLNHIVKNNLSYKYLFKIHTKSPLSFNPSWRKHLMDAILKSPEHAQQNLDLLDTDDSIGMIGTKYWTIVEDPHNQKIANYVKKLGISNTYNFGYYFVAGTIFLARYDLIVPPLAHLNFQQIANEMPPGKRIADTEAHWMERIFGFMIYKTGRRIKMI